MEILKLKQKNMENSNLNLFHESRLVFRTEGPKAAPESSDVPGLKEANEQRDLGTEAARTEEKINRILHSLDDKKPNSRTEKIKKHALEIKAKLEKFNESRAELTLETLDKLNTTFDNNIQGFRIQVVRDVLQASVKDIDVGNVSSLITAFALLKSDDRPLSIPNSGYSIHRRGHLLVLEHKGGKDSLGKKMPNEKITFKVVLIGEKWQIQHSDGGNLPERFTSSQNPLAGAFEHKLEPWRFYSKEQAKLNYTPKEEPIASQTPEAPQVAAKETAAETSEEAKNQFMADTFKVIANPDVSGQNLTREQLKAFLDFTKDIKEGGVKYFKHGNDVETYVSRSQDGDILRISTKIRGEGGYTADKDKYYAPHLSITIGPTLPNNAEEKAVFAENPEFTIKTPQEAAAERKPEDMQRRTAESPVPNAGILENQDKQNHANAVEAGMKNWNENFKNSVGEVAKSFEWQSKVKDFAKKIQQAEGGNWEQAARTASRFVSWLRNFDRSIHSADRTGKQNLDDVKQGLNILPKGVRDEYSEKFQTGQGETLYASLERGTPPSSAEFVRSEAAPTAPTPQRETSESNEGYAGFAKAFNFGKIDIKSWEGTGPGRSVPELMLVFGLKEGKSEVMKDGKGNEFYFVVKEKAMEFHIKEKNKGAFEYAFKEVDGKRVMPEKIAEKGKEGDRSVAYDRKMEANFQTLRSQFRKLKKGEGVGFNMKDGTELIVHKVDKNTLRATYEDGKTILIKDLKYVRTIATLISDSPEFKKPKETKSYAKSEVIVDGVGAVQAIQILVKDGDLKNIMQSPEKKSDLQNQFKYLSQIHSQKSIAHTYEVSDKYSVSVSADGVVKLTQKGIATVTYSPKKKSDSAEA